MDQATGAHAVSAFGLRKAAVALSCLHPDDRTWLLERLRPSCRYDLRRLIWQVESLGISDVEIAQEAVRACETDGSLHPPAPDRLLAGMRGLSPSWCARVLAACAPDHMDVFAANNIPARANAVRAELLSLPKLPPRLAEALTRIVRERGEHMASPSKETH